MKKIIDFEKAKQKIEITKHIKKIRKIYNDIDITYYYLPTGIVFKFKKDVYIKEMIISYLELESFDIEGLLKFNLNNFCYEVYEKREKENNDINRRK